MLQLQYQHSYKYTSVHQLLSFYCECKLCVYARRNITELCWMWFSQMKYCHFPQNLSRKQTHLLSSISTCGHLNCFHYTHLDLPRPIRVLYHSLILAYVGALEYGWNTGRPQHCTLLISITKYQLSTTNVWSGALNYNALPTELLVCKKKLSAHKQCWYGYSDIFPLRCDEVAVWDTHRQCLFTLCFFLKLGVARHSWWPSQQQFLKNLSRGLQTKSNILFKLADYVWSKCIHVNQSVNYHYVYLISKKNNSESWVCILTPES